MRCPSCGLDNPQGMNFCGRCGTKLGNPCPHCGFDNPAGFQFCGKCGTSLTSAVPSLKSQVQSLESKPSPTERVSSTGERRQLTVEFIDLVGSTTLSQQLDPEDYHARVRAYQAACHQVIARYEGHIAQYLGDGVLVYFGYPAAHDEDAVRAVRSGLDIVAAVGQLKFTPPLRVRIGIHTGPVVVGEIGAGERSERLALI